MLAGYRNCPVVREVAKMKHFKAKMFNRKASNPKSKSDQILQTLALRPKYRIADIGAGGGYFALRFATAVGPEGKVYAIDINPDSLQFIRENSLINGLDNVETVNVEDVHSSLPKNGLDLIFMRNVYHHLPERIDYFRKMAAFLKPNGKVVIIEYKSGGSFSFHKIFGHHVSQQTIIEEMEEAGYLLGKSFDFLPEQSFAIFDLKK